MGISGSYLILHLYRVDHISGETRTCSSIRSILKVESIAVWKEKKITIKRLQLMCIEAYANRDLLFTRLLFAETLLCDRYRGINATTMVEAIAIPKQNRQHMPRNGREALVVMMMPVGKSFDEKLSITYAAPVAAALLDGCRRIRSLIDDSARKFQQIKTQPLFRLTYLTREFNIKSLSFYRPIDEEVER